MPDRYEIETHYYPALLNSIPFLLLGYYFLSNIDSAFWSHAATATIGGIGIASALYWLQMSMCRAVGKVLENTIFDSGKKIPTTELLLLSDSRCSSDRKNSIARKVEKDFGIRLKGRLEDTNDDRIFINEAVGQIRTKMGRKNALIAQRNRQYGFVRNMLGGTLLAEIASLLGVVISIVTGNDTALNLSIVFAIMYGILAAVMFMLLRFTGVQYAMALYDEYLASK